MVDKIVEMGILFDFYGKLLSDRQYLAIELYYIHDLSLGEIGEELRISRQGVYDTLKRAENKLYEYENNLGLVKKFYSSHKNIENIVKVSIEIKKLAEDINEDRIKKKAEEIYDIGSKILDNSREVVD
jgi:predicted DNA-binding protein YlxM (UPF0122 family)